MARAREFDPQEALGKAMELFWRQGYAETSMRDLVAHTGVAHAGLYSAFGDKRGLYERALQLYADTVISELLEAIETPDASRPEIEKFFADIVAAAREGLFEHGCLLCNAVGVLEPEIVARFEAYIERVNVAFHAALIRAQKKGEVGADVDIDVLADLMSGSFHGGGLLIRAGWDLDRMERYANAILAQMG